MRLQFAAGRWLTCVVLCAVAACGLLIGGDVLAIDGNYASPYASQYDTRDAAATVSNAALLGMLLAVINALTAGLYALRSRRRTRDVIASPG